GKVLDGILASDVALGRRTDNFPVDMEKPPAPAARRVAIELDFQSMIAGVDHACTSYGPSMGLIGMVVKLQLLVPVAILPHDAVGSHEVVERVAEYGTAEESPHWRQALQIELLQLHALVRGLLALPENIIPPLLGFLVRTRISRPH